MVVVDEIEGRRGMNVVIVSCPEYKDNASTENSSVDIDPVKGVPDSDGRCEEPTGRGPPTLSLSLEKGRIEETEPLGPIGY